MTDDTDWPSRDGFRRLARRAAELLTGERSAEDEPLAVTREKAGI